MVNIWYYDHWIYNCAMEVLCRRYHVGILFGCMVSNTKHHENKLFLVQRYPAFRLGILHYTFPVWVNRISEDIYSLIPYTNHTHIYLNYGMISLSYMRHYYAT